MDAISDGVLHSALFRCKILWVYSVVKCRMVLYVKMGWLECMIRELCISLFAMKSWRRNSQVSDFLSAVWVKTFHLPFRASTPAGQP